MKNKLILLLILFFLNAGIYAQIIGIKQIKDSLFVISATSINQEEPIFWNSKPDSWKNKHKLFLTSKDDTVIIPFTHPVFKEFVSKKEKPAYFSSREIKLKGANNFRDLGGYLTNDGRKMK